MRIQRPVFECLDDRLFLNRNVCFSQAVGGFPGQTAGKTDRFHISSPKICSFVAPLTAQDVRPSLPKRCAGDADGNVVRPRRNGTSESLWCVWPTFVEGVE